PMKCPDEIGVARVAGVSALYLAGMPAARLAGASALPAAMSAARLARALTARDLGRERVDARRPEVPELLQPCVDLREGTRIGSVDAPRAFGPNRCEPALSQHFQLLRDGRLRDAEFPRDDLDDLARCVLALGQELEDAAPDRIAEDVERVHQAPV